MTEIERLNSLMRPYRRQAELLLASQPLDGELASFLDDGLVVDDGCVFFAASYRNNRHHLSNPSRTGREAIINKLYLDEVVDTRSENWAAACLAQGLLLAREVLAQTSRLGPLPFPVEILISLDPPPSPLPSSSFRFYLRRPSDPWISDDDDLEGFVQPVLVVTSSPTLPMNVRVPEPKPLSSGTSLGRRRGIRVRRLWIHIIWLSRYPYNRRLGWSHKDLVALLHVAKRTTPWRKR